VNLVLLEPSNFIAETRARLQGRALHHIREVHRANTGDTLRVGVVNGRIGRGTIESINIDAVEMSIKLDTDPPSPLPLRLILALPRPKVLNRTIAAAVSMGIREIDLINAWRVEKAYWESPRLSEENLREQSILGLEQAGDLGAALEPAGRPRGRLQARRPGRGHRLRLRPGVCLRRYTGR